MRRNKGTFALVLIGSITWACDGQVDVGAIGGDAGNVIPDASEFAEGSPSHARDAESDATPRKDGGERARDAMPDVRSASKDAQACVVAQANDAASCTATCSTPAGTVQPFECVDQVYGWVAGQWQFCTPAPWLAAGAPSDSIGVEFAPVSLANAECEVDSGVTCPTGDMYFLVQGTSGPVRGSGFAYQWTYDVSLEGSSYQFNMHPTPNSGTGGSLLYSPCPTEIDFTELGYSAGGVLVPF